LGQCDRCTTTTSTVFLLPLGRGNEPVCGQADCVTTPYVYLGNPKVIDGIRFNEFWNPVEYSVLGRYPGATAEPDGP
jgi:hypothetical protein